MDLGVLLEFPQGSQSSSRVGECTWHEGVTGLVQSERRESRWQRYTLTETVARILDQVFKKQNQGSDSQTNDFSREKLFQKNFFH